ncbi:MULTISPECIES: ABC transporter permease [unclassified Afipia]|uniref:ABC transporter permease n=1 Tax=unclassified Afipia TaxID=2642050 RepID=UPI0009DD2150|nr:MULTISPECIES: ABC transporter permease [unclassified Afipia]
MIEVKQSQILSATRSKTDPSGHHSIDAAFLPMWGALRSCAGIGGFILLWQLLSTFEIINPLLLPSPIVLLSTMRDMIVDGSMFVHAAASLERVLVGFAIAAIVGMTLGVALGWWSLASELIKPIVEALRPIPPIAWTPLAILWFGVGNAPSYFLVFIGAVFPIFVNTFAAVKGLDHTQVNAARCLGAGPRLLVTDVVIPGALPIIFPGLRIALGVGWMCVVAAELIAAQSGLGYMIQQSRMLLQTHYVLTGMVVIGIIGFAMDVGMVWLERRLIPWKGGRTRE